jgi:hypothetical protein
MGPPSDMRSVVNRNVVMRRIPVPERLHIYILITINALTYSNVPHFCSRNTKEDSVFTLPAVTCFHNL